MPGEMKNLQPRDGLRSEIENPLTGKPVGMRDFLSWTLNEVRPLAEALGLWEDLSPLVEMAEGSPNTAERLRARLRAELGPSDEVPVEILKALAEEREDQVRKDVETIAGIYPALDGEAAKLAEFLQTGPRRCPARPASSDPLQASARRA